MKQLFWALIAAFVLCPRLALANTPIAGDVEQKSLLARHLDGERIGLTPKRTMSVYLPPGYHSSTKHYPVVYYLHSIFWSPGQMFEDGKLKQLIDRGIRDGDIGDFIFVAADFTAPNVGTFFGNSPVTGRWLDHIVKDIVPFVDAHYRTLPSKTGRGIAGDAIGGYAALKVAMLYPELFNAVYAMHPVGTGPGLIPMPRRTSPDWRSMNEAQSWEELPDGISRAFMTMAQAHLPNPDNPPFYCDLIVELRDNELVFNPLLKQRLQKGFSLDEVVTKYAEKRGLAGIKLDWGRYDSIQDHVYANQAFTRQLHDYGIDHEAEEYGGNQWEMNWTDKGRFAREVLPFFGDHLEFGTNNKPAKVFE